MKTSYAVALSALLSVVLLTLLAGAVGGGVWWLQKRQQARAEARDAPAGAVSTAPVLAQTAAGALLDDNRVRLETTRKPLLRLQLQPMAQDDRLAGKVGGRPYWTAEKPYPHDAQGRPLALLAQIDLAAMPALPDYPRHGLLQFFIASGDLYGAGFEAGNDLAALSEQRGFRVVYWPRPDPRAAQAPVPLPAADALPFDPARPRALRFVGDSETIGANDVHFAQALGRPLPPLVEAYARHARVAATAVEEVLLEQLARGGHKLGGYPEFTQSDPRRAQDPQVLLLQLDSDEEMMWGDSGIAHFFIDPADLRRGDFSRVAYHWDCY